MTILSYSRKTLPKNYDTFGVRAKYVYHITEIYLSILQKSLKYPVKKQQKKLQVVLRKKKQAEQDLLQIKKDLKNAKRRLARAVKNSPKFFESVKN